MGEALRRGIQRLFDQRLDALGGQRTVGVGGAVVLHGRPQGRAGFVGHGLCDTQTPWFNALVIGSDLPRPETLHPTITGHGEGFLPAFRRMITG